MTDIVERLTGAALEWGVKSHSRVVMLNARDEIIRLRTALEACAVYLDDRSDVVWEGDAANEEMRLLTMVQTALGER